MKIIKTNGNMALKRNTSQANETQRQAVHDILQQVQHEGDQALLALTEKFDGAHLASLLVSEEEIEQAYDFLNPEMVGILHEAAQNIRDFQQRGLRQSWITTKADGTWLGQNITPLDAAGVYVPGGTAAYPSSLLMGTIPAQVAGVGRICVTTPPSADGTVPAASLVAAREAGVTDIYKVGGAQAIGALAYGTETVAPVDKIVGPGNAYVALAKREVFGTVAIDSIAGPSEIAVLSDGTADPAYVAADLLSQAEHDPQASAVLFTPSETLAEKVAAEVEARLQDLPRKDIVEASLADHGAIYVTTDLEEAIASINAWAPEHLEVMVANPSALMGKIRHAGAIFLGPNSSEPVGDYFAGPNHVLPTGGTARFSGPLSVDDFIKTSSLISYSDEAMQREGSKIAALARVEGLEAHARAIEARLGERG